MKRSFKSWQWHIIISSMIVYAVYYFVRKNFSIAMPGLTAEYGISNTSFGIVLAIGSLIYGFSRFVNGFVVERISTRIFMAIGLLLCAGANFCFAFGVDITYWLTGIHDGAQFTSTLVLVMGITIVLNQYFQGFGYPPCARMLPHWIAPGELATKMSIWNTSHSIGSFLAVVLCGAIMTHLGRNMSGDSSVVQHITENLSITIHGWDNLSPAEQSSRVLSYASHYGSWRMCFIIPAIVAVLAAIFCLVSLKDSPESIGLPEVEGTHTGKEAIHDRKGAHRAFLRHMVFRNRWVWMLAVANIFVYVLRMGVLDWGPKFLTEDRGMNINSAAWSVAVFELSAIVGTIFAGWASDHIFHGLSHRMCLFSMLGAVIFLGVFALIPLPTVVSTAVLAIAGFCIYGPQALIGIGAANQATKEASATANGVAGICGYVGSALSALGVGLIADHFGWNTVFLTFIAIGLVGVLIFGLMWKAPRDGYERSRMFTESLSGGCDE